MNARVVTWAAVVAAACAAGVTPAATQGDRVALLLSRAREALGGSAALNGVQSLVLRGTTTKGAGHTQSHGEFEISAVLPDRYVRVERNTKMSPHGGASVVGHGSGTQQLFTDLEVIGLNGLQPIYRVPLLRAETEVRRASLDEARTIRDRAQREVAWFAFGVFAAALDNAPLAFSPDPQDADALVATGAGVTVAVRFHPITHLPARFGDMEYGDYRDVGGRRVPHLITKHIAGRLKHVWRVEQVRVNVEIDAKVFRPDAWTHR